MKFSNYKSFLLALALGWPHASADISRVEVMYVDGFTFENPLVDADGVPLTAGGPENDDGAIFQVGYFRNVSHLLEPSSFGEAEWTQFTPLTGVGSPNAARHPTTIGGIDSGATGPFGFLFYPSPVAIELDTEIDDGIPLGGVSRLGVRFYDGTTLENSTGYNIVTSGDGRWILPDPEAAPTGAAVLDMDNHDLVWASGVTEAFRTSMSMAPEPATAGLLLVAGFALARRRRPAASACRDGD